MLPTAVRSLLASHALSGIYVYRVTVENGFEELGRISTQRNQQYEYYYGSRSRGVFISQNVYAVTDNGLDAAPVTDVNSGPWSLDLPE